MPLAALFDVIIRRDEIPASPAENELITLAVSMHARGLTPSYGPGDHGNLSCRTPDGFLISARETSKRSLRPEQLVSVLACERTSQGMRLTVDGRALPSTDALMHWKIYAARPDIGAIVHGHDQEVLKRKEEFGLPTTRISAKVNSLELIDEVCALSAAHDYLLMRDHGFIALGATLAAAEERFMEWFHRARA